MRERYARLLQGDLSAAKGEPELSALAHLLGAERSTQNEGLEGERGRAHSVLAAFLRHDAEFVSSAAAQSGEGIFYRIIQGWHALYHGHVHRDDRLVVDATTAKEAFGAVVAQSLGALGALVQQDMGRATMLARRASRMARVEGLLAAEYLANLVLARARRHSGQAFLCLRIGSALEKVVPPLWRPWLSWELLFAGGPEQATQIMGGLDGAAADVAELVRAAAAGRRGEYELRRTRLLELGLPAALKSDFDALDVLLDPRSDSRAHQDFIFGASTTFPIALSGWPSHEGSAPGVCVLVRPGERGRRLLPTLLSFAASKPEEEVLFIADGERKSRVHAFLSALALTPQHTIEEAELFERVWGFAYVPDKHQTLMKTVVVRARADVEGICTIERAGGVLRLIVRRPFALSDPRCRPSLHDRLLGALASSEGRVSAKDAAAHLGVSVRYVQSALKNLVEDGACERVKDGRNVEYALEDTTFDQPTLSRLTPRSE